ncbi:MULTISPECIES: bifunctional tRNA (5-methylaminomethyl-2-thiouridine)(34)-methyltransferase MnmD/FAD-dependent 5-carboxymethylaminomethyl-2-thiouridine(34) oxidoreductase MnmC [Cysteiniphilum]|uniref:tRNA 5-methylaminomethyl-2-thiouridine biosynthesis bifunctional protein MnmC n=1 Tax=Cysteiniphilum litorale TaxID=2056700 RepID=A0A8J2Z4K3_9GAMM|nr:MULTISPECIES: bifunctional tRNA (5-methylaminomethyl-2-thiouridine)(34)-methyltransferase MnmD/FAD-dependent 5-carboxymethylaminomethyl-2-thiouridine(34) oxidoreductase MnmC [Cysteiniphilum]GGF98433.1 tRNA 5-methylaminomethyl-2-thiouridine biosynthesis bifunctional protein MnmC [Cysteiniphilum litorale]
MQNAKLKWQETGEPFSDEFADVYFSKQNGLAESEYVFLDGNQLKKRFENLDQNAHFVIAETGFGTGLNFLATLNLWDKCTPKTAKLSFISCEKYPLTYGDLEKALSIWHELKPQADQLLQAYPNSFYIGATSLNITENINLTLLIDDAANALAAIDLSIDAWFLDGFAPAKNPDMWSDDLFKEIYRLSHGKTSLSTFTAAGFVKRALEAQGFEVKKQKGFAHKREMICAVVKDTKKLAQTKIKPYFAKPQLTLSKKQKVAIIGAGMAGCALAYELSQLGFEIDLFDQYDDIAQGASGNPYGILKPYITADANISDNFHTQGFVHTRDYILKHKSEIDFNECGALELLSDKKTQLRFDNIIKKRAYLHGLLQIVDAATASEIAGCDISKACAYYPTAMMVNPYSLCQSLIRNSKNVNLFLSHRLDEFVRSDNTWQLRFTDNKKNHRGSLVYDAVVFAGNALLIKDLEAFKHIEVYPSYGQITQVQTLLNNKTIILDQGYILPSVNGKQLIGATFRDNNDLMAEVRQSDHNVNLAQLSHVIDPSVDMKIILGRVSLRCVTADHVPMIGAIADNVKFIEQYYQRLQKGVILKALPHAEYLSGLYLLTGFGSKGLCSMMYGAKILAQLMSNGCQASMLNYLIEGLHPLRFNIRTFKKG